MSLFVKLKYNENVTLYASVYNCLWRDLLDDRINND